MKKLFFLIASIFSLNMLNAKTIDKNFTDESETCQSVTEFKLNCPMGGTITMAVVTIEYDCATGAVTNLDSRTTKEKCAGSLASDNLPTDIEQLSSTLEP